MAVAELEASRRETGNRLMLNVSDLQYSASGNLISSPNPLGQSHSYLWTAEDYLRCIDNCYTGSYLYNSLGERTFTMHQTFYTWNENVYLNGQPMADVDNNGTWTDYIYANGQKIAMVASQKPLWHMHGQRSPAYNNMGCGVEGATSGVGNVNGILDIAPKVASCLAIPFQRLPILNSHVVGED